MEWFDDDSFWRELYDFMFSPQRFKDGVREVAQMLKLLKRPGKTVLDLGCGPGRCSIPLVKRGFKVTGVDRTRFLLKKARVYSKKARLSVEWVQLDMRDFKRPNSYDLVVSMYTSFGYFDNKDEDRMVLANVFQSLRPGGKFFIDLYGKELMAQRLNSVKADIVDVDEKTQLVRRDEVFDDWSRVRANWILIRAGKAKKYSFHFNSYSGQELKDRLCDAGFTNVTLYGGFDGRSYGPGAVRLIAIAEKPAAKSK
jgi:SAM-dependent methyltransferase